jgi:hypothetical protein
VGEAAGPAGGDEQVDAALFAQTCSPRDASIVALVLLLESAVSGS